MLIPVTSFANIAKNPYSNMPDSLSASNSLGPQAHLLNPAFSARYGSMVSYRYLMHRDKSDSNHLATIGLSGFSFTYGRLNSLYSLKEEDVINTGTNFYNIAKGFSLGNIFVIGAGYSFATSRDEEFDHYRSLSLGFLFSPFSFLSFGVSINDTFAKMGSQDLKHNERYSMMLRPFSGRFRLSTDAIRPSGESFKHIKWEFAASILAIDNIQLYTKISPNNSLTFGATIAFSMDNNSSSNFKIDGQTSDGGTEIPAGYHSVAATMTFYRDNERLNSNRHNHTKANNKNINVKYNLSQLLQKYEIKGITGSKPLTYSKLTFQLKQAIDDSNINIIILNLNGSQISYNDALQLRSIIKDLRANGKTVFVEISNPGEYDYFVATSADKIYYNSERKFSLYAKAPKVNLNDEFITTIMTDRSLSKETMELLVEKWNISSAEAKELGFIDDTERIEKYYPITYIDDNDNEKTFHERCNNLLHHDKVEGCFDFFYDSLEESPVGEACSNCCGSCYKMSF